MRAAIVRHVAHVGVGRVEGEGDVAARAAGRELRTSGQHLGQPEVGQQRPFALLHQYVAGLDIAVDDVVLVGIGKSMRNGKKNMNGFLPGDCPSQFLFERSPG